MAVAWAGMTLPNVDQAIVEEQKVTAYLLDSVHPENRGKAGFFLGLGFSADNWALLAKALREHARDADAVECVESSHGRKYIVEGMIRSPSRRASRIRSIWIIDQGEDTPRLVTAYPRR